MKRCLFLMGMLLGMAIGCAKSPPDTTPPEADTIPDALEVARQAFEGGDTGVAIQRVEAELSAPGESGRRAELFRALLDLLLMEHRVAEAQARYKAMLTADPGLAVVTHGIILDYLRRNRDDGSLLEWTQQLLAADMPNDLAQRVFAQHVAAYRPEDRIERLTALVERCVQRFGAPAASRIMGPVLRQAVQEGHYDAARTALDVFDEQHQEQSSVKSLVVMIDLAILAGQGSWDAVQAQFQANTGFLNDRDLMHTLASLAATAVKGDGSHVADNLCLYVIREVEDRPRATVRAGLLYIQQATPGNEAVLRMQALRDMGMRADNLRVVVGDVLYRVMAAADSEHRQILTGVVAWCLREMQEPKARQECQGLLMDAASFSEDYATVLAVLEDGFRADEKDWHAMAVNKVKAHIALADGRVEEAVRRFKAYMEHVTTWEQAAVDPSTGIRHGKEMTLGFNAARIGDLLAEAGQPTQAAEMYREARVFFQTASENVGETSREMAWIRAQLSKLPKPTEP